MICITNLTLAEKTKLKEEDSNKKSDGLPSDFLLNKLNSIFYLATFTALVSLITVTLT